MILKALVFDFDGTILDTETPDYECWQEIYQEHRCELTMEEWAKCVGTTFHTFNPFDHLEKLTGAAIDRDRIATEHRRRVLDRIAKAQVSAGVHDCVAAARSRGLKLGVASSSTRDWVTGNLKQRGLLDQFDCIRCADDVKRVKPDPELYIAVVDALGVQPHEVVAFEDSPNGARAAKAAGLYCVAIPNPITCKMPLDHADLRVGSLSEVVERILTGQF